MRMDGSIYEKGMMNERVFQKKTILLRKKVDALMMMKFYVVTL